jgi:hypothetical protein
METLSSQKTLTNLPKLNKNSKTSRRRSNTKGNSSSITLFVVERARSSGKWWNRGTFGQETNVDIKRIKFQNSLFFHELICAQSLN